MHNNSLLNLISCFASPQNQEYIDEQAFNLETYIEKTNARCLLWNFVDDAKIYISSKNKKSTQIIGKYIRTRIVTEINHLSSVFSKNNIKFLIIKGIPMEYVIYHKCRNRDTSDIDLFVSPYDIKQVLQILEKAGYHFVDNTNHYRSISLEDSMKLVTRHIVAVKNQLAVEVHYLFHFFNDASILGDNVKLQENWEKFYRNRIIIDNDEIKSIPTLDICDSMILITNHILFEMQAHRLLTHHTYLHKLFIDSLFLIYRIQSSSLCLELFRRSQINNYKFGIQIVLIHLHKLFNWYDEYLWNLFELKDLMPYIDTFNYDNSFLLPIGEWNLDLCDRFFGFSDNDMAYYIW